MSNFGLCSMITEQSHDLVSLQLNAEMKFCP